MIRTLPRFIGCFSLTIIVFFGGATPASADYKADYAKGLEAAQRSDWPEVARLMRSALSGSGREGRIRIYGMRFEEYLPHYYLGVALAETGDCSAAIRELKTSAAQGFIKKLPKYADLQARMAVCEERTAANRLAPTQPARRATPKPPTEAINSATTKVAAARDASGKLEALRSREGYQTAWSSDPSFENRVAAAQKDLEAADTQLTAGEKSGDVAALASAGRLADQAGAAFGAIERDLANQRQRVARQAELERQAAAAAMNRRIQTLRSQVEIAARGGRSMLSRIRETPVLAATLTEQRNKLETLVVEAGRASSMESVADLEGLRDRLTIAVADTKSLAAEELRRAGRPALPTPSGPPANLRAAAGALFSGDYQTVLDLLENATFTDPRAIATSSLLMAAARHSMYLLGGGQDEAARAAALAQVQLCRRARPDVTLDPNLFSPRFVAFFNTGK